ncbi:MAG: multicopper oxidase domain-containing protein [Gaiellaceae bacterium]
MAAVALLATATATHSSALAARAAGRPVAVTLREFAIVLPARLRPGPTTFVLHNRGRFPHNFTALYGPSRFHSGTVPPGATRRLAVTLAPGEYLVACTILNGGHLAQGMLAQFTIGSRTHGSGHWHYP